uniref:CASP-like protein n=1 Tax=Romanomermis culicivorax TaxID=13658 RepID=A0A915IB04_ROMCU
MTAILIDSSNIPFLNEDEKQKLYDEEDVESGVKRSGTVADARLAIRLGFLRKVFGILAVQLLITTAVGIIFVSTPVLKAAVIQWYEFPYKTGCQSYTVGVVASFAEKDVVVQAFFLTTVVVISLLFYTMQTKRDFSAMGSSLFAVLCVLIIGGILQTF